MTPLEARNIENSIEVYKNMSKSSDFYNRNIDNEPKYKIGDHVRILLKLENPSQKQQSKFKFRKGFKPKFSDTIYKIYDVKYNGVWYYIVNTLNPGMYIASIGNRNISERVNDLFYYENELIKIT